LLRTVQLPEAEQLLSKYPHEVSGGQRQRIMIAMALLPEPKLIVADEPTTALDVTIQAQVLRILRDVARDRGLAVLFTTHDLGTAWEICNRVTVMYAGQELETAEIEAFFHAPMVPYTRLLLASLPTQGSALKGIPGSVPNLVLPPAGCRFNPRCPSASAVCQHVHPPARDPAPGHSVRCHHPAGVEEAAA
jgi:peptide/nickel transport system ATP-binding protein